MPNWDGSVPSRIKRPKTLPRSALFSVASAEAAVDKQDAVVDPSALAYAGYCYQVEGCAYSMDGLSKYRLGSKDHVCHHGYADHGTSAAATNKRHYKRS